MNFKTLVLEELNEPTYQVIRDATEQELTTATQRMGEHLTKPFDKGWLVNLVNRERLIVPNYTPHSLRENAWLYIVFTKRGSFDQFASARSRVVAKSGANSLMLDKAIKKWEFIKHLSKDTQETFGGLIDEL
jgi:hypothetical protein